MRKAFVLFLACGLRCLGAEDCTLTVRVTDEVGQPVSNATVEVGVISARGFNARNHSSDYTYYSASDDSILANVGYSLRYRSYLPLYSLRAACGVLGDGREVAPEGWVKADGIGRLDETMVVVRAEGNSMEPKIHDGDLCVVRKIGAVDYDNRIVLVQRNDKSVDPETGGAYLLKKLVKKGGKVLLRSLNGDYRDIEIASGDDIKIVAEFKSALRA